MEIIKRRKRLDAHPYIPELKELYLDNRVTRREFLRMATLLGMSITSAGAFLAACAPAVPETAEPSAVPTLKPSEAPTVKPTGPRRGGTLTIASRIQRVDHPARITWMAGANQFRQVCEFLSFTDFDNITHPWLLERWEVNEDVDEWTLYVRKGVKFNDGQELTADDVVFNFQQWLDPEIGSSMLGLMNYLSPEGVERLDAYTVKLHLSTPQIGVPEHLFNFPAMIVPKTFEGDIARQPIGTGPFLLEDYVETERASFVRREDYWQNGADGKPLPYLERLVYLDLGEEAAPQIAALQSGQVDNITMPSAETWQATKDLPGIAVQTASTGETFVLRMRADVEPWSDNRLRQALKKCMDRQKILDLSYFGQGILAHDAHIAPIHPEYCEKSIPAYDPEGAKALLAEAGYADGLTVELTAPEAMAGPAMAQSLKESAAAGGINIEIKSVPASLYWDVWTEVPLGITHWTHLALGTMALDLAYVADQEGAPAAWNETHWVDEEFSDLLQQADRTLDVEARRQIMCQLEDIQMSRGSVGIPFWANLWYICRETFKNVKAHPSSYDVLNEVWFEPEAA